MTAYALTALAVLAVLAHGACGAQEDPVVSLSGSPEAIGTTWGFVNAELIRQDMQEHYLSPAQDKGLTQEQLIERNARFVEICREIAPHWLDECRAIAEAAGVDPALYTAYAGGVYRGLWAGDECTSYAVSKKYMDGNAVVFHKNRDNVAKPQAACVVASDVPGVNRFMTVTDAAILSCMMMVNDKGLAGSADVGGLRPKAPRFRGMMNTYVLRYIAERAASCDDALAILTDLVEKGYYAGGAKSGTHWLFVDKTGAVLEVSNNATELTHAYHTGAKVYFSVRGDTPAAQRLRDAPPPISFHAFHDVSRDPSLCFDSSISGMTVEIDPDHPDTLTCAWFTFPAKGLAFPLFMGCGAAPKPLVDGEVYTLLDPIAGGRETWEQIERAAHRGKELVAAHARGLIEDGEPDAARELLQEWANETAGAQTAMLRLLRAERTP